MQALTENTRTAHISVYSIEVSVLSVRTLSPRLPIHPWHPSIHPSTVVMCVKKTHQGSDAICPIGKLALLHDGTPDRAGLHEWDSNQSHIISAPVKVKNDNK